MNYLRQIDYVYGPYSHKKSGRKIINLQMKDGRWRPVSYPKFLVEVVLGRELDPRLETVDHVNGDFHDNDWRNMRIVDNRTHSKEDAVRVKLLELACVYCTKKFLRTPRDVQTGLQRGVAGPFCSKKCAGRYGTDVQNNKLTQAASSYCRWEQYAQQEPTYYTLDKGGETVADLAIRRGLRLPTEKEILKALPRRRPEDIPKRKAAPKPKQPCAVCRTPTENKKYCSSTCDGKARQKIKWPTDEKLQRLVWRYPTTYIAKRLGVSDVAVAKHCKKRGVERPPRGYWAKKRAEEQ